MAKEKKKTTAPADEPAFDETQLAEEAATDIGDEVPPLADDVLEPLPDELDEEEEDWDEETANNNTSYLDDISDDSVRLYLREIGKIPLLSAEEELLLARRIKLGALLEAKLAKGDTEDAGAKKADDKKKPLPQNIDELLVSTADVESLAETLFNELNTQQIEELIAAGKTAKDKMAEANLRLVVSIAKRYSGRGLDFMDLIQEGNSGLLRAVEKFDPDKGFKFSTYATWWIRQAITRAIADQARTIRIPVHMVETINKLLRTQRRLTQELNREPTIEELAKEMEMEPDKIEYVMKIKQDITSLDANVRDDDDDSVLQDFLEDETSRSPEEVATYQLLKEQLASRLEKVLSERELKIIKMRFGLEDGKSHTLEEVGHEFGVTRERIRQIEAKGVGKARKDPEIKQMHEYLQ